MPYKRPIQNYKKYVSQFYNPSPSYTMNSTGSYTHQNSDFLGIPLPNEKEIESDRKSENEKHLSLQRIINYIQKHIRIEEILLIGLIVMLLDESFEDDLLLIVLIYILLF